MTEYINKIVELIGAENILYAAVLAVAVQSLDIYVERRPLKKNVLKLLPAPEEKPVPEKPIPEKPIPEKPAPAKHTDAGESVDIKEPYTTLPPGAASSICNFVKAKYRNEKNYLLIFNAIVDGSDKKIRECAETIADSKNHATHLIKAIKNASKSKKVREYVALLKKDASMSP